MKGDSAQKCLEFIQLFWGQHKLKQTPEFQNLLSDKCIEPLNLHFVDG